MATPSGQKNFAQQSMLTPDIYSSFDDSAEIVLAPGDCEATLKTLPRSSVKLIITSPPYNIGKAYERASNQ